MRRTMRAPTVSSLLEENALLRREVQVARRASQITAELVIEQFVKLEDMLRHLEEKNAIEQELLRELEAKNAALTEAVVKAMDATAAKSRFLTCMSHEIRTPLNAILPTTELLLATSLTSQQREQLEFIHAAGESLLALLDDVLNLAKIECENLMLVRKPFDLHDVVGDSAKTLAVKAHQRGLELACHIQPDVPKAVIGDHGHLRHLLLNMLGNAIKFTRQGEVILEISVESQTDEDIVLHFSIRDTGIGVPEDKRTVIFEMFEKADDSTQRCYGGSGLGLTISARLVKLMEGKIWLDSEVDKGSTFHFTAHFDRILGDGFRAPSASPKSICDAEVLVFDDNATNRHILECILRSWQARPTLAASADEASRHLRAAASSDRPFQLLIADAHVPDTDGFEFIERVQTTPEYGAPAVIALTLGDEPSDVDRCEDLAVAAHLLKPVKQSELFNAIAEIFGDIPSAPKDASMEPGPAPRPDEPLHILLVEDSPVNQRIALALLGRRGHQVVLANNGVEALEYVKAQQFDLVLMDIQMPEMDGHQATEAIRLEEQSTGAHLPIIALTAHALQGDRERCLESGMDEYVAKPIKPDVLFETIDRTLISIRAS